MDIKNLIRICEEDLREGQKTDWPSMKDDYILRSFSKIQHKPWELYIITKIINSLSDPDIEFVCQQHVDKQQDGQNRQLLDLCFPSLKFYVEIDEPHHGSEAAKLRDAKRDDEVFDKTNFEIERIEVENKSLCKINREIEKIVTLIQNMKIELGKNFEKWNIEDKYSPIKHIRKGIIRADENVAFRYHRDALRCFGYLGKHHQRAVWHIPGTKNRDVWFPKLYKNNDWENTLSDDWTEVTMKMTDEKKEKVEKAIRNNVKSAKRDEKDRGGLEFPIIFGHYRNALGNVVYKFLGEYEKLGEKDGITTFERRETEVVISDFWYD